VAYLNVLRCRSRLSEAVEANWRVREESKSRRQQSVSSLTAALARPAQDATPSPIGTGGHRCFLPPLPPPQILHFPLFEQVGSAGRPWRHRAKPSNALSRPEPRLERLPNPHRCLPRCVYCFFPSSEPKVLIFLSLQAQHLQSSSRTTLSLPSSTSLPPSAGLADSLDRFSSSSRRSRSSLERLIYYERSFGALRGRLRSSFFR
jgi:hypothetical protein